MSTDTQEPFLGIHPAEERRLCREIAHYLTTSTRLSRLLKWRHEVEEKDRRNESHERGR